MPHMALLSRSAEGEYYTRLLLTDNLALSADKCSITHPSHKLGDDITLALPPSGETKN